MKIKPANISNQSSYKKKNLIDKPSKFYQNFYKVKFITKNIIYLFFETINNYFVKLNLFANEIRNYKRT